ncbi:MAG TPA: ABC transporter permease [Solirubrobacteraceae bacterium]|nr:ABC transporter permease [Solirubrobacteraceae bacterium]
MLALIAANLRRRRARTLLTAAGIGVGVAAVVALLALSAGLNRTAGQLVHLGRADLGLFQKDAGDPTSSVLPLSLLGRIRAQPEIVEATPIQLVVDAVHRAPAAIVLGLDPRGFVWSRLVLTSGGPAGRGQAMVGDLLAHQLHLGPGAPLRIGDRTLTVSGVYHAGIAYEDLGVITQLRDAQALAGRTAGETTTIAVRLAPQLTIPQARRALAKTFPGLSAISDPSEAIRAGANSLLISKAVVLIVVLALIIGALAVANTMLAAVLERRRELALLTTIGWSARQLGGLVLGEAIAVSLLGTALGLVLGLAASKLLPAALGLGAFISPVLTAWGLGRAALIGIAIGALGALYPIWRVTRMRSAVALALT